jgi:hypothetical protein
MSRRVNRRIAWSTGLFSFVAVAAIVIATGSDAAPGSIPLRGKMRDITQISCGSATHVCSTFVATGDINGDGLVSVDTFPNPAELGFSKAHTVIHTAKGDLRCGNEGALFDLTGADHAFVDLCLITGGTGTYDGASGYIQEVGTFDFAANRGELDYYGKLIFGGA